MIEANREEKNRIAILSLGRGLLEIGKKNLEQSGRRHNYQNYLKQLFEASAKVFHFIFANEKHEIMSAFFPKLELHLSEDEQMQIQKQGKIKVEWLGYLFYCLVNSINDFNDYTYIYPEIQEEIAQTKTTELYRLKELERKIKSVAIPLDTLDKLPKFDFNLLAIAYNSILNATKMDKRNHLDYRYKTIIRTNLKLDESIVEGEFEPADDNVYKTIVKQIQEELSLDIMLVEKPDGSLNQKTLEDAKINMRMILTAKKAEMADFLKSNETEIRKLSKTKQVLDQIKNILINEIQGIIKNGTMNVETSTALLIYYFGEYETLLQIYESELQAIAPRLNEAPQFIEQPKYKRFKYTGITALDEARILKDREKLREEEAEPKNYVPVIAPLNQYLKDEEIIAQLNLAKRDENVKKRLDLQERVRNERVRDISEEERKHYTEFIASKKEEILAKAKQFAGGEIGLISKEHMQRAFAAQLELSGLITTENAIIIAQGILSKLLTQAQYEIKHDKLSRDYVNIIKNYDFDTDAFIVKRRQKLNDLYNLKKRMEAQKVVTNQDLNINDKVNISSQIYFPVKIFVTLPQGVKLNKDVYVNYSWTNNLEASTLKKGIMGMESTIYEYKSPTYSSFILRSKAYNKFIDKILADLNVKTSKVELHTSFLESGIRQGGMIIKYIDNTNGKSPEVQKAEITIEARKKLDEILQVYPNLSEIEKYAYLEKVKKKIEKEKNQQPILLKMHLIKNEPTPIDSLAIMRSYYPNSKIVPTYIAETEPNSGIYKTFEIKDKDLLTETVPFYLFLLKKISLEKWSLDNYRDILLRRKTNKFIKHDTEMIDTVTRGGFKAVKR